LDLDQFLWKKRILLIEENTLNTVQAKSILEKSRIEIKKSKKTTKKKKIVLVNFSFYWRRRGGNINFVHSA
jgi:hypothetical protein